MKAIVENLIDAVIAQTLKNLSSEALGFVGVIAWAGVADGAKAGLHFRNAKTDGAGMLGIENEHFSDASRLDGRMVLAVISLIGADGF